ncbi:hypothetical protein D3C87_1220410 [compost metagenome]|jgi:hypothetical protein|uniref:Uncharacterized protein n=2 Tax=Agrobacterium tumefaciens complex TaxID=1183400 RepID=A0AAP9LGX2_AGRTU|nr:MULTISPECIES: hypothetical protein [Agrobacterium]MCP2132986.1 hypothetical protein [Rhizobium sp. SLBN-94]KWT76981.1 hypothetical protein ASH09_11570 [Agrobacterium radiobacter]MBB4281672.1 hypothetical protein [Agrobacterium radiobacter]MBB4318295.1 hypothetical protein [Agrobacterium radiobacter]MBB4323565.1 hypothetical protein [Agrobacterium radiobacter]
MSLAIALAAIMRPVCTIDPMTATVITGITTAVTGVNDENGEIDATEIISEAIGAIGDSPG